MSDECEAIVQAGDQILVSVDHAQPGDDIRVTVGSGDAGPVEWEAIQGKPSEFVPVRHAADHAFDGADPVTLKASQVQTGIDSTYFSTDDPLTQTLAVIEGELVDRVSTSDTRLVNSREWTAATVDQAEAEAGTATTRRAWTAQRVRQAIAAWWAGLAVPIAKVTGLQAALDGKSAAAHAAQHGGFAGDPIYILAFQVQANADTDFFNVDDTVQTALTALSAAVTFVSGGIDSLDTALGTLSTSLDTRNFASTQIKTSTLSAYGFDEIDTFVEECAMNGFGSALTNVLGGAPASHAHDASAITTGTLAVARMPSQSQAANNLYLWENFR